MGNKVRSNSQYWLKIVIIIVILWGVFFRVTNIDKKIYWHDEVYTSLRVAGYKGDEVVTTFFNGEIITVKDLLEFQTLKSETPLIYTINSLIEHPEHPPLYYLLLRFWQDLFGSSIIINRSLSILFSLLIFPAIYYLSQQLFNNNLVNLISISLIAISPVQILYAQEAREYSLWMLSIILSSLFFFKSIKTNNISHWFMYSLTLSLTFYTSILSAFLPIIKVSYIYLIGKILAVQTKINFLIFTSISGILFIPWLVITVINFSILKDKTNWTNTQQSLELLANLWGLHFTSLFIDFGLPLYHWASYIFIIFIFSIIFYSFFFMVNNISKNIWLYLLLLVLIPTLGLILPDLIFGGIKSSMTRYFFPAYLSIYLTIAYTLGKKIEQKSQTSSLILIIIFTLSIISNIISSNAQTWWNKASSYHNAVIAQMINQAENPLVITQNLDINKGNIISISHNLKPETKLQLLNTNTSIKAHPEFKEIYIFNPSPQLINSLEKLYHQKLENKNYSLYYFNILLPKLNF
ncbi:glycosyltransferase family 39 protein [Geminocystis herdmanii]|uniref:glycosyltransferase family 39 protein n=1 Tax=Geminocystis herdmanii TaxID=669359 RepID=UPI0003453076|nr:glycosyltransferase family 39 protein [Geminocystis herdmanii]